MTTPPRRWELPEEMSPAEHLTNIGGQRVETDEYVEYSAALSPTRVSTPRRTHSTPLRATISKPGARISLGASGGSPVRLLSRWPSGHARCEAHRTTAPGVEMSDREKDELRDDQKDEQTRTEAEDLDVPPAESDDVKGGKVQMQDFHFTTRIDKTSP